MVRLVWLVPLVLGSTYVLFAAPALLWGLPISIPGGGLYEVAYLIIHWPVASVLADLGMRVSDSLAYGSGEDAGAELVRALALNGIVLVMVVGVGAGMGWSLDRALDEDERFRGLESPRVRRIWSWVAAVFCWPVLALFFSRRRRAGDQDDEIVSDSDDSRSGPASGRRS